MRRVRKVIYEKLARQKAWGMAHTDDDSIVIDPRIKGRKHLEIVIHETLHIIFPAMHEQQVEESASEVARVLWKENYRKVDNEKGEPLQTQQNVKRK